MTTVRFICGVIIAMVASAIIGGAAVLAFMLLRSGGLL